MKYYVVWFHNGTKALGTYVFAQTPDEVERTIEKYCHWQRTSCRILSIEEKQCTSAMFLIELSLPKFWNGDLYDKS